MTQKLTKYRQFLKVGNVNIEAEELVKLLGIYIDFNLTFDFHNKTFVKKQASNSMF